MKVNPYKILLDTFGEDIQFRFAIEEMSELTKAICKYQRKIGNATEEEKKKLVADIVEELADVYVTTDQLSYMFGEKEVNQIKKQKLERALKRASVKNTEIEK